MPKIKTTVKSKAKVKMAKTAEKSPKQNKFAAGRAKAAPKSKAAVKTAKYFQGLGRRKTAIARVRIFSQSEKAFSVNEKPLERYFPTFDLQAIVLSPLEKANVSEQFKVSAKVKGGGCRAQAEAVRQGISRALILFDSELRKELKRNGFLTRDSRMRERKKFGLKRARRAPQWSKR
ncbi:MAG: 30S ribosomal protein S9 [bacterium]